MFHNTEDIHIKWTKVVLPPVFLEEELPITEASSSTIFNARKEISDILDKRDARRFDPVSQFALAASAQAIHF